MISLDKFCDDRTMNGYKSALLYKLFNEKKYHLLIPLETAPSVSGSVDTFDFDILTCPSKGKVEGKETLDQKDVDFMWHRDNVARLEELQGKVLDFMVVYQDFTARAFTGTIKVRPQDAGADIMKGTFTITPMSASSITLPDARDMIKDTIVFTSKIPTELIITDNGTKSVEVEINTDPVNTDTKTYLSIEAHSSAKYTDNNVEKDAYTLTQVVDNNNKPVVGKYTIKYVGDTPTENNYSILTITAKPTDAYKEEYASWTTSIALSTKDLTANI